MRVAGQPEGRLTAARRRFARSALAPAPVVGIGAIVIVAIADGWRLAVLAALVAAAVMATRLRFGARVALGLLLVVALLAIGGWGPGFDRRPLVAPPPAAGTHSHSHGAKS